MTMGKMMSSTVHLSDAEVDAICDGLTQNAAKVRYLRDTLKVPVERKPNGRPLVRRIDWERQSPTRPLNGPRWSKAA